MTVVVCVMPPPVPVIVIVWFPAVAKTLTLTFMVEVPAPGAAMELGVKVTPMALPCTEDKAIAESKPPETVVVIVELPVLPLATVIDVGFALMVKFVFVPVTVRETLVVSVVVPDVPVTVIVYVPGVVDDAMVMVITEVPLPVIEVGLKPTVTPVG